MDRSRTRPNRSGRRFSTRLRLQALENRTVPAAALKSVHEQTIAVGFRTGDPSDPIVPHAVVVRPGQTIDDAIAQWRKYGVVAYAEPNDRVHAESCPTTR